MLITKFAKQRVEVLKINQPDLLKSIELPLDHLSDKDKGVIAGLIIEYVLKSGGSPSVFEDNLEEQLAEYEDEFN